MANKPGFKPGSLSLIMTLNWPVVSVRWGLVDYIYCTHYIYILENIKTLKSPYAQLDFRGLRKSSKVPRVFGSKLQCVI